MRRVDGYAIGSQAEQGLLLGVLEGDRFEGAEDDRVVCDDGGVVVLDCFLCDGLGEVDGQKDGVPIAPRWEEGRFEQETGVVEGLVGQDLGIETAHRGDYCASEGRCHPEARAGREVSLERRCTALH